MCDSSLLTRIRRTSWVRYVTKVLDQTEVVIHSDDMFAPVALLRVLKCHAEPKAGRMIPRALGNACHERPGQTPSERAQGTESMHQHRPQAGRSEGFDDGRGECEEHADASRISGMAGELRRPTEKSWFLPYVHEGSGGVLYLSGVRTFGEVLPSAPHKDPAINGAASAPAPAAAAAAAATQIATCLAQVRASMQRAGASMADVCFVHLYLRDMNHFATVNAEYCR